MPFGRIRSFLCSECICDVSLSGQFKIGTEIPGHKNDLTLYAVRNGDDELSFHEWFKQKHKNIIKKKIIPNYVGVRIDPIFPVSASYARSILLVHIPWKTKFATKDSPEQDLIAEFYHHLENDSFPSSVTVPFYREKL